MDGENNFTNGALMGSILGRNQSVDQSMYGMNGMWNNPFVYLVWMMFADQWRNRNGDSSTTSNQLSDLQNQMQDNHNSDLLMSAISGNKESIQRIADVMGAQIGQVQSVLSNISSGISALNGNVNLSGERVQNSISQQSGILGSQIQNTGCQIKTSILEQGYQSQLSSANQAAQINLNNCQQTNTMLQGFNALQNSINNGFNTLGYQLSSVGCEVRTTSTENTHKILDYLTQSKQLDQATTIQQLRDEVGRLNQTQSILAAISGTKTATTTA